MRNTFLITAILSCLATAAVAAEQQKAAQQQSQPAEQAQMAHYEADGSMDHASSAKSYDTHKQGKRSKRYNAQSKPEGNLQASQNQVEYGGGG